MVKKLIAIMFALLLISGILPIMSVQEASAETQYYIDVTIDFSSLSTMKIGQRARDVTISDLEVSVSTNMPTRPFDEKKRPNASPVDITVKEVNKSSVRVVGNSEHGPEFISVKNILLADITVTANGDFGGLENNQQSVEFRINGVRSDGSGLMSGSVVVRSEEVFQGENLTFQTLTDFRISLNCAFELTGRTCYEIKKANDKKIDKYSDIGWNMPKLAEPGVSITFYNCLSPAGIGDVVEYHTINGKRINHEETFVMPAQDVEVGIVLKGSGGGGSSAPKLVDRLDITLDFKSTDPDIYNGKKVPTAEDLKKAIKLSASVSGSGAKVSYAAVDEIYDESFYAQEDIMAAEKWAGNLMLTFKVALGSGYTFSDADISPDEKVEWQEENVEVNLNGKRLHFMQGGLIYANGYFTTEYYMSGSDEIEVHVFWYGIKEADYDISNKRVGEKVEIPDSAFDYDGYFVYKYVLSYVEPENGVTHFNNIEGKSFTMPASEDGVKLMVKYLRGDGKSALVQVDKEVGGALELETDTSEFPDSTVVTVDKVTQGEKHMLVESALSDAIDFTLFDISAFSYGAKVQPDGRVILYFPIPSGYDADRLALCYISADGQAQELLLEVDKDKNLGIAVLEHFSLYAIVSTREQTDNEKHVIHIVSPVPRKDATCDEDGHKAHFQCGCGELFGDINASEPLDAESIILKAGHTDANNDGVCDKCNKGDLSNEDIKPEETVSNDPSVTDTVTDEPDQNTQGTSQPTTQPTTQPTSQPTEAVGGSSGGGWLIPVIIAAVVIIAVVIILIIKKKK